MAAMRAIFSIMLAMAGLVALFAPGAAVAANFWVPVFDQACIVSSADPLDVADAMAREEDFVCDAGAVEVRANHIWLRIDADQLNLPDEALRLESDFAPLEQVTIAVRYADGGIDIHRFDARQVADFWTAGARFSLPLAEGGRAIDTIFIGLDRPWSTAIYTAMEVITETSSERQRYGRSVLFAIYCGLTLVPILYSIAFYLFMRYRFMLLHAMMAAGILVYTFASSNLMMHFFPDTTLWVRLMTSYASLSFAIGMFGFFAVSFVEKGMLTRRERIAACAVSGLLIANTVFMLTIARDMPFLARNIYHAAYAPAVIVFAVLIFRVLRRRSRAGLFLFGGWAFTSVVALDRIARGLDVYILPPEMDFSLYFGLTIEAIVTAFGVADRFVVLRRDRDDEISREIEQERRALTDELTGLPNRRAFDLALREKPEGALAVVDIDRFGRANELHGRQIGDNVLRTLGNLLRETVAKGQCKGAYRLDGDKFAVLFDVADAGEAALRAEALRHMAIVRIGQAFPSIEDVITVSIGVALAAGHDSRKLQSAAHSALAVAKRQGRNRIEISAGAAGPHLAPSLSEKPA